MHNLTIKQPAHINETAATEVAFRAFRVAMHHPVIRRDIVERSHVEEVRVVFGGHLWLCDVSAAGLSGEYNVKIYWAKASQSPAATALMDLLDL